MAGMKIDDPALEGMTFYYSLTCFDVFEELGVEKSQEVATHVMETISLENPLLMRNKKGEFDQFDVLHFGKRSGPFCAVLMAAFLVWRQKEYIGDYIPSSSKLLKFAEQAYDMRLKMS